MFRMDLWRDVPVVMLSLIPVTLSSVATVRAVEVELRNLTDHSLENAPITFGQVFVRGEIPRGKQVHCLVDGRAAQVDRKRTYDDGSLRFAVVSAFVPTLAAAESRRISLTAGDAIDSLLGLEAQGQTSRPWHAAKDLLKTPFDATLSLTFPDGSIRKAIWSVTALIPAIPAARKWPNNC